MPESDRRFAIFSKAACGSAGVSSGTTATVTGGGKGHRSVLFTPSLSDSGTLNLTANDLYVQDGGTVALAAVSALIARGYNNGVWTGGGITSSSSVNDTSHLTALGVILNNIAGAPFYTTFDGAAVAVNDVLMKETYYGDANLDGKVDASDYSRIDNGCLSHLSGWYNGDFNYDGVVNGSDYTLIDNALNTQGAQLDSSIASVAAVATAQTAGAASVPEPVSGVLLGAAALAVLGRRCRRSGTALIQGKI